MLVLHAGPHREHLLVWAESNDPLGDVKTALQRAGMAMAGDRSMVQAMLPPGPSTPLLELAQDRPSARAKARKKKPVKTTLDTLRFAQRDAIQLLRAAAGERVLAPGVLVGADLAWCAMAMRYAAALVARGHVVPSVDGDRAIWLPLLVGDEGERFAALVASMPPVVMAFDPAADARVATRQFVGALADAIARAPRRAQPDGRSLHERWLTALTSGEGRITASAEELTRLKASVDAWLRPVMTQAAAPFRLAFRLEEPVEDDTAWRLHYLMQGRDDRSLLLPAAKAPRELLLRSLGEAAAISSTVERELARGHTEGLDTDATGAFAFLTRDAAALESAGFGVFLPSWWSRKGTKKRMTLRGTARAPRFKGKSGLSFDSIVEVDWRIAVGDAELTETELKRLAKLKEPLVKVRGQWVQLSAQEIGEALSFLKSKGQRTTLQQLVRTRLTGTSGTLEIEQLEGAGPLRDLLERLEGTREWEELPEPEGFSGTLRPYQKRGYSWLRFLEQAGLGACLADDMGLGKTIQTLALLQSDWPLHRRPTLLICPTSVTGNWLREAQRFTPALPVLLHHGTRRARGDSLLGEIERSALVISSYSLLHREAETLGRVAWRGVVLDEAQNIKNSETRQSKAARALPADFRIALTGTPVENNVGDLWSIMEFLNPGLLGNAAEFRRTFFLPIQTLRDAEATATLKRITGPFILRRLKSDKSIIADLPEKNEMKVFCTLTKEQATLYKAVVDEMQDALADSEGIERKGLILATLGRLKQVCNHPAHFLGDNSELPGRSGKLARLTEMLEESVSAGDHALVFTQYAGMGTLIQRHVAESLGLESLFLHGATSRTRRDEMVERFQNDPHGPRVFILSLKAGGTGLNLTRANHVFHFDRWWNPAVENQATDRAFRIGQTKSVQVHKFVCAGTLEERVDELIEGKQALARNIVGTGEGWLTELSNTQLRAMLTLGREAIGE
ncbi:MAG: DEAD/DEAH box helicase [Acidobacteriota bacterium]